ncbi:MAG: adenylyltransferase/cytidyltransferase family protein [Clostridia bacterium]|nr:adenylyltransferase/cytidyltransferase family protein [Clostridia bacterium]
MKKVITYGTYDLLHYGHIRLLERAKKLGDYLIVGVTADDFDKTRGKINVQQSLIDRVEAVRATGLADKIIVEEYEGQKIDDIKKYGIDIFTVGSDWKGKFDYLNEYCEVVYLDRTQGISSSEIRAQKRAISMGIVGDYAPVMNKFQSEDIYVNGIEIIGICTNNLEEMSDAIKNLSIVTNDYDVLLNNVESVYIRSNYNLHYEQIKKALNKGIHVLCESPICLNEDEQKELFEIAKKNNCILMEAIKTAYSTAYSRLLLLLKSGRIGRVISVDAICSSLLNRETTNINSFKDWGSTALLPVFQILGTDYREKRIISSFLNDNKNDAFTKVDFIYENAVASIKVAEKAKSEGELIITGTEGYIYVPAPWWKTDYFELRYENQTENKRYFYQLDGEGIRYELLTFVRSIQEKKNLSNISEEISYEICKLMSDFENGIDVIKI